MDIDRYYRQLQKKIVGRFTSYNRTDAVEQRSWTVPAGSWEVQAVRGDILEKATASRLRLRAVNPLDNQDTVLSVLQINIYPSSPLIPVGLCNLEYRTGTREQFAGYLDTASAVPNRADQDFLSTNLRQASTRNGCDYETLRRKAATLFMMDGWEHPLNDGIGIRIEFASDQFGMLAGLVETWFDSFFAVVDKRAAEDYDHPMTGMQNMLRTRFIEYFMLKDLSCRVARELGIPFEALTLMAFPPVVRF